MDAAGEGFDVGTLNSVSIASVIWAARLITRCVSMSRSGQDFQEPDAVYHAGGAADATMIRFLCSRSAFIALTSKRRHFL